MCRLLLWYKDLKKQYVQLLVLPGTAVLPGHQGLQVPCNVRPALPRLHITPGFVPLAFKPSQSGVTAQAQEEQIFAILATAGEETGKKLASAPL